MSDEKVPNTPEAPGTPEAEKDTRSDMEKDKVSKKQIIKKYFLSAAIACSFLSLACYKSLSGPTLVHLAKMVNSETTSIPIIFTTRSMGYILGCILGAVIFDNVGLVACRRQFLLIIFNVLTAVSAILIPFCNSLATLSFTFMFAGIFLSCLDVGLNTYILQIWEAESHPYLQILALIKGVGSLISPILARLILQDIKSGTNIGNSTETEKETFNVNNMPSLKTTYLLLCVMLLIAAGLWLLMWITRTGNVNTQSSYTAHVITLPGRRYMVFAVATTALLMFVVGSIELGYQHMLATFAFSSYGMSTSQSSDLTALFWAMYTTGAIVTLMLSRWLHPHFLIILNISLQVLAGVLLISFVNHSNQYLALGNAVLGLGASSLFANTLLWCATYIEVTHRVMAVLVFAEALAEMVIPEILSLMLHKDRKSLSYFVIAVPVSYFVIFLSQCVVFYSIGEKYTTVFDKSGKSNSRRRIFPIFLYKYLRSNPADHQTDSGADAGVNEDIFEPRTEQTGVEKEDTSSESSDVKNAKTHSV